MELSTTTQAVGAHRTLTDDFDAVVERAVSSLKEEGFGVLCDIDVKATLKEKLDVDRRPYRILGACNPPLADQAMQAAPEIGVLLPCNVVVRELEDGQIRVDAVAPENLLALLDPTEELEAIAQDVDERLHRALERL